MREVKGRVVIGRRGAFQVLALVTVLLLPLGVGVLANRLGSLGSQGPLGSQDVQEYIQNAEVRMVESLLIIIAYHPELARYMRTIETGTWEARVGYRMQVYAGGLIKIEQFTDSGEVKITVGNETVGTFKADELKANVKMLNLTVEGLPLKIAVAIRNVPIYVRTVPNDRRGGSLFIFREEYFSDILKDLDMPKPYHALIIFSPSMRED
ncbi:MAG: hypothetical protein QW231_04200 [Candidatus Bathyarchaeia archaeon]